LRSTISRITLLSAVLAAVAACSTSAPGALSSGQNSSAAATMSPSVSLPPLALGHHLENLSCASATSCVAVGYALAPGARGQQTPLAEISHGSAWTVDNTFPGTPGSGSNGSGSLGGISCPAPTSCMAVGTAEDSGDSDEHGFADLWNGSSWSDTGLSPFVSGSTELTAVSCPAPDDCVAVGQNLGGDSSMSPYAVSWDGNSWALMPGGATQSLELHAVSCWSRTGCVAVGDSLNSAADSQPALATWNGSTWSVSSLALPAGDSLGSLTGVSCLSSSSCEAVGNAYGTVAEFSYPVIAYRNGASWQSQLETSPAYSNSSFDSVSCTAGSTCLVTGGRIDYSSKQTATLKAAQSVGENALRRALEALGVVHSNGLSVRIQGNEITTMTATPVFPKSGTALTSVACLSPTQCIATGNVGGSYNDGGAISGQWNGTAWVLGAVG
jgi:hypothetical protein